jgi:DHA1 family bicyclomycin/chloramphenicol resistance-like MFS transporter
MGFREFVAILALMQASVAMAIDMMIPALGQIDAAMHLQIANQRQDVISAFLLGFGAAQILYGFVADSFGRRIVLLSALAGFATCSFIAAFAPNFDTLLAARAAEGVSAAGIQVLATAVIRDCYAGRRMAEVNSLTFMVFLAAPIVAPSIGQALLLIASWPVIFVVLGLYGTIIFTWIFVRLPETQARSDRRGVDWREFAQACAITLRNRTAVGYTAAMTALLGGWFGYINSAQQIFEQVFHVPKLFPVIFAACSVCMAVAALTNARFVERLGMRPLSHGALTGYILFAAIQATLAATGHDTLLTFALLMGAMMFNFGLLAGNIGAISMEPLGHVAGTAASLTGFVTMLGATIIGFGIGQAFNGTLVPTTAGFVICAATGFVILAITERGRLFRATSRVMPAQAGIHDL